MQAEENEAKARQHLALADQRRQLTDAQAGLRAAKLNLKQAELAYETARQAVADTFVRAPRSGAVLELPVHPGDRLTAGSLVARIATLDPLTVDLDVPPRVVNRLKAGDRALVDVPAIRLSGREARIWSIASTPQRHGQLLDPADAPRIQRATIWQVRPPTSRSSPAASGVGNEPPGPAAISAPDHRRHLPLSRGRCEHLVSRPDQQAHGRRLHNPGADNAPVPGARLHPVAERPRPRHRPALGNRRPG